MPENGPSGSMGGEWKRSVSHRATPRPYYNFCWSIRTLDERDDDGRLRHRTPAMAAGLADHVWTMREWITMPGVQHG